MAQSGLVASDADDAMLFAICMGFLVVLRHFFLRWYGMVWKNHSQEVMGGFYTIPFSQEKWTIFPR
jgi:hypothetical protein